MGQIIPERAVKEGSRVRLDGGKSLPLEKAGHVEAAAGTRGVTSVEHIWSVGDGQRGK